MMHPVDTRHCPSLLKVLRGDFLVTINKENVEDLKGEKGFSLALPVWPTSPAAYVRRDSRKMVRSTRSSDTCDLHDDLCGYSGTLGSVE